MVEALAKDGRAQIAQHGIIAGDIRLVERQHGAFDQNCQGHDVDLHLTRLCLRIWRIGLRQGRPDARNNGHGKCQPGKQSHRTA